LKKSFFMLIFALNFAGAESFINNFEYGEMLYKNPRGVGCDKCHGKYGEGMELGSYQKNNKIIKITAPKISKTQFADIKNSLKFNKKRSVMPEYFLTDIEVEALIYYLRKVNEGGGI
jgi:hypothetical protein